MMPKEPNKKQDNKKQDSKKQSKEKKQRNFFKDFKAELKKVSWPTPKQLLNNTVAVITVVLITAAIVFVLDFAFESMNTYGIDKLKELVDSSNSVETTDDSEDTDTEEAEDTDSEDTDSENTETEDADTDDTDAENTDTESESDESDETTDDTTEEDTSADEDNVTDE